MESDVKKNPVDGGRYQKSVKSAKRGANFIARRAEADYKLPRGSVKICITKLSEKQKNRLASLS